MRNKAIASFLRACARAVCCLAVGVFVGALAFGAVSFFHVRAARPDAGFWETVDLAVDEGFLPFLLGGYPQDWLSHLLLSPHQRLEWHQQGTFEYLRTIPEFCPLISLCRTILL